MTNEEAVRELKALLNMCNPSPLAKELEDALRIAIKVLEQGDILDKIEEEINSPNRGTCDYFIADRIEEIINKYKAESEDAE